MNERKRYLQLRQDLLSNDPAVRENQVVLDSLEFVTLSAELREWMNHQSPHWAQLDTSAQIALAQGDCNLSQEAKDLFAKWARESTKRYLASNQTLSDKEAFEKQIGNIKRQAINELGDLGVAKQIGERIFSNHLLMEIAFDLRLELSRLDDYNDPHKSLKESLKRDFYPYDGTKVPYIDIGWLSTEKCIYGPPRLPLDAVFRKPPFPLEGVPATLYLISINLPELGVGGEKQWKIGITKKSDVLGTSGKSRFSGRLNGFISDVDSIRFSDARDAYFLEQKIIHMSSQDKLSNKSSTFRVRLNPASESILREIMMENNCGYEVALGCLKDLAQGLGLGPTEWIWKGRSEDYVRSSFRSLVSYAPYFGDVVKTYIQAELPL